MTKKELFTEINKLHDKIRDTDAEKRDAQLKVAIPYEEKLDGFRSEIAKLKQELTKFAPFVVGDIVMRTSTPHVGTRWIVTALLDSDTMHTARLKKNGDEGDSIRTYMHEVVLVRRAGDPVPEFEIFDGDINKAMKGSGIFERSRYGANGYDIIDRPNDLHLRYTVSLGYGGNTRQKEIEREDLRASMLARIEEHLSKVFKGVKLQTLEERSMFGDTVVKYDVVVVPRAQAKPVKKK